MASNPPPNDPGEHTTEDLLAKLGNLKDRPAIARKLITELQNRDPDLSLNKIAELSGIPSTTVARWKSRADT